LGWPRTVILPILASQVAGMIGVSPRHRGQIETVLNTTL
jgi:hypothetical protein